MNVNEPTLRLPSEWCKITGITVMDPDGWRSDCRLGDSTLPAQDWQVPISEKEFRLRAHFSTCSIEKKPCDHAELTMNTEIVVLRDAYSKAAGWIAKSTAYCSQCNTNFILSHRKGNETTEMLVELIPCHGKLMTGHVHELITKDSGNPFLN